MRALVTGATGFLGSRLVRTLVADGHRVGILARATSSLAQVASLRSELDVYDIEDHVDAVRRAVVAAEPDVVFHLATYYARDHRLEDLDRLVDANIAFPLRLVDAMAREGVRALINTGSAWQFFDSPVYRPVCLHSATKAAFEALLTYFIDSGSIDCITLMMHDSYGPGDPRRKIFTVLREHAGRPEPLAMSAGQQQIDLIHVDDAIAAYVAAARRLTAAVRTAGHEVFSVSGGEPLSLRRVVEMYLRYADLEISIDWGGRPYHSREVMTTWTGGQVLPDWRPQVGLEAGLRELAREPQRARPVHPNGSIS